MTLADIANVVNNIHELLSEKSIKQVSIRKNSELIAALNEPLEFLATLDDIGFSKEDGSIAWYDCFERAQMLHVNMRDGTRYTLNLWLG